jgi:hypothetical protein
VIDCRLIKMWRATFWVREVGNMVLDPAQFVLTASGIGNRRGIIVPPGGMEFRGDQLCDRMSA